MGHLRIKASECKYQEQNRRLKEQFMIGINDKVMTSEIIRELTASKSTREVTHEQVLA